MLYYYIGYQLNLKGSSNTPRCGRIAYRYVMVSNIEILYEDAHIIVCVKPAGMLSQGDKKGSKDLVRELKNHIAIEAVKSKVKIESEPYVAVVHRLDRNVRGIMVYAKTKKAAADLSKQISENKMSKIYMAVVSFNSEKVKPAIDVTKNKVNYIMADKLNNVSSIVGEDVAGAERAELNYKVVKVCRDKAIVRVELITGRHHQIRLQLSDEFNGIVGDTKYNDDYKGNKGWSGLALEAVSLSFTHPISGKALSFSTEAIGKEFGEI